MSDEIKISYATGSTLYFRAFNATGQVWNTSGTPAFENWAGGSVTDYDVALADKSSGEYIGDFPSGITEGTYQVIAFLQAGGSPATGDVAVSSVGTIFWSGSAERPLANQNDVLTAHSTTDALINAISLSVAGILNIYDET